MDAPGRALPPARPRRRPARSGAALAERGPAPVAEPLLRWRAPWYVYAVSLLALPLLAVLVVGSRRHLPGATVDSAGGGVVSSTLRVGLLEALVAGPWAVAWFGYGVPVLLHRWSALATALALGLLSWSSSAMWFLIHGDSGWPEVYLNLGSGPALAVIAVWLFQRARGSVWPVLILEGTGAAFLLRIGRATVSGPAPTATGRHSWSLRRRSPPCWSWSAACGSVRSPYLTRHAAGREAGRRHSRNAR